MSNCSICLENIDKKETFKTYCCKNYFHYHCLENWFQIQTTCPLCRTEYKKEKNNDYITNLSQLHYLLNVIKNYYDISCNLN